MNGTKYIAQTNMASWVEYAIIHRHMAPDERRLARRQHAWQLQSADAVDSLVGYLLEAPYQGAALPPLVLSLTARSPENGRYFYGVSEQARMVVHRNATIDAVVHEIVHHHQWHHWPHLRDNNGYPLAGKRWHTRAFVPVRAHFSQAAAAWADEVCYVDMWSDLQEVPGD